MGEAADGSECLHPFVIAVAGYAIFLNEFLMKRDILSLFVDGYALRGANAYLLHLMAGNALLRTAADERRMTGKAIVIEFGMRLDGFSGTDHQVRGGDRQQDQNDQIGRDNE